jgi:lipooligosaccharide transport system permease protein
MLAYATFMTAIFQSLFGAFIRMRYQRTWEGQTTSYIAIVGLVLSGCQMLGVLQLEYLTVMLGVLVPLDLRLLRKRALGD